MKKIKNRKKLNIKEIIIKYRKVLYCIGVLIIVGLLIHYLLTRNYKMVCTLNSNQKQDNYELDSTYTVIYRVIVKEVKIKETVTSKEKEVLDKFEKDWKSQYEYNNKTYRGYTYEIKQASNKVVAYVLIDYQTMNVGKYIRFNEAIKKYSNGKDQITATGMKEMLEKRGYQCK